MEARVPPLHPESESESSSPKEDPGVEKGPSKAKSAMLEKFQALQRKRLEVKKQSTEDNKNEQDRGKSGRGSRKRKSEDNQTPTPSSSSSSQGTSAHSGEAGEEGWSDIKPYLDVNAHLRGIDHGRYAAKTKLEEEVDAAVARGDLDAAETLSDQLSTRDFGKKIADAIDAKRFDTKRQEQEEQQKAKRKKKLPWGFHHKERWEMKGNM